MDRAALRWGVIALLLLAGAARAAVWENVGAQQYSDTLSNFRSATADGTCQAYGTSIPGASGGSAISLVEQPGGYVQFGCRLTRDGSPWDTFPDQFKSFCPVDGSTAIPGGGRSCYVSRGSCPAGQSVDSLGVCQYTCPGFGTQTGSSATTLTSRGDAFLLCIAGCQYAPSVQARQSDGAWAAWGPYTSMGLKCTGAESGGGTPAPAVCPPAQCMGEVNGTSVCKPCGDVKEPPKTTETSAPPADAGSAPSGATPGSSSTTEQTSCSGGQCTTTRTTTTVGSSGGQTSQTSTTTQPIGTYCSVNPGAAVCAGVGEGEDEEPSTWGGSCAGFQCGGDAIQCAIAREQHTRNCALFDQATDLSRVGTAAATGENPADHPRSQAQSTTFALSSMLDASPLFGSSGGCPADVSFAYAGQTLVIPFSQSCDVLHMLGAMWMGICYLVAATIVFYRR